MKKMAQIKGTGEGKLKKAERKAKKVGLRSYYVKVQNQRTKYTKIVSRVKAFYMVHGVMNEFGERVKTVTDEYKVIA